MIRIGLLSFSDGRERVHRNLSPGIAENARRLQKKLEETGEVQVIAADEIIWRHAQAREQARAVAAKGTDGTILNVPVFAFPNLARIAGACAQPPFLAFSPVFGGLPGLGGMLGVAAGLEQTGVSCEKVYGSLEDETTVHKLLIFCRAAHAVNGLKGRVLGLIGGRSIGMVTGEINPDMYYAVFGLDVDHFDQSEILRRASLVPDEKVEKAFQWLVSRVKDTAYDGKKLTPENLKEQIRHYYATKSIIEERQFDFVAVKCHYELSEFYSTQCLSAAFMNDPYDWDGQKEPVVFACEADADGAVTMQILKLMSGKPVVFTDLRHYDESNDIMILCNCGAISTWYARRSDKAEENLKDVSLVPLIPKYGGKGCHVRFVAGEGPMTFARLFRRAGRFHMTIFRGNLERFPEEKLNETCSAWPHLFARLSTPAEKLIPCLGSNHVHGVAGDYTAELVKFCEWTGIEAEVF
ncbi:MAG: L-fucose/L-arabinose isomerase family protein [Candidatus Aminicenantes bacterium]|nr:L-fucose/L-arabinose isomerase family protein [Candidatus Aminicenantes bacterium]